MKKFFTFIVATLAATNMMAQHSDTMKFAGKANVAITMYSYSQDVASDTVTISDTNTAITLPAISGNGMTIPSIKLGNLTYTMSGSYQTGDLAFTWEKADTTVTVGEKDVKFTDFKVVYEHFKNKITVSTNIKYGSMPAILTYTQEGFYLKDVTGETNVSIGGAYNYTGTPTYTIRKYTEDEVVKLDVEISTYTLTETLMGDLTLGTYTVKGLTYDSEKEGYYRDYANDGLTMHFTAVGSMPMDDDYPLSTEGGENILVKYNGSNIAFIENNFQPGNMPSPITATYGTDPAGIDTVNDETNNNGSKKMIVNGKLVIISNGVEFNAAGQRIK